MTSLLQIYLFIGLLYGASVVAVTEVVRPPHMMVLPLRLRLRIHVTVLALGTLKGVSDSPFRLPLEGSPRPDRLRCVTHQGSPNGPPRIRSPPSPATRLTMPAPVKAA